MCVLFNFSLTTVNLRLAWGLVFVFAWPRRHCGVPFASCKWLDFPAVVRDFATVPGP